MSDQELMASIKARWGALLESVAATSSVPESFFAALVANESAGNPDAKRFEPAVFGALAEVLLGRKAAYGSLGGGDIRGFVLPSFGGLQVQPAPAPAATPVIDAAACIGVVEKLESLATSWGLMQIMGYEAIAFHLNGVDGLKLPVSELPICVKMLVQFSQHFGLDLGKDFEQLFDCWNTGRPHAPTADPNYIRNGIARKMIYEALR